MQYRKWNSGDMEISALGFGCMRFPLERAGDSSSIDREKAFEMIEYAYKNGVNYFDTAYTYHGGKSEEFVGESLKKLGRERVNIATKMPVWLCNSKEDYLDKFEEQLLRLRTNYIDFYLAHATNKERFEEMKKNDYFSFLEEEKERGRIKFCGFSFHDDLETFKEMVDYYDWDFCQVQFNYMDEDYQAGIEGIRYAKEKGLDVIIMEPVKGGKLAQGPEEFKEIFNSISSELSLAQWALKWVYNFEEVSLVLSGMSSLDQVKENMDLASYSQPESMSKEELKAVDRAKSFLKSRTQVACTECEYCLPCPENVAIPTIFRKFNNEHIYRDIVDEFGSYKSMIEKEEDASRCVECGSCESLCPQNINIIDSLKRADRYFRDSL